VIEVCIPMRDRYELTRALVTQLVECNDFNLCRVFDNGSREYASQAWLDSLNDVRGVEVIRRPDSTIYQMWNEALAWAPAGTHVAILNNDITVPGRFLHHLSGALQTAPRDVWITYPDWDLDSTHDVPRGGVRRTHGTRNLGGMSGYAFMVDVDSLRANGVPPIDESFEWLCGDGDLIKQVEARGGCAARVLGLGVDHLEQATSSREAWTFEASQRDVERRKRKYGG
jgi:hypothetical protein